MLQVRPVAPDGGKGGGDVGHWKNLIYSRAGRGVRNSVTVAASDDSRQCLGLGDVVVDTAGVEPVVVAGEYATENIVLNMAGNLIGGVGQEALLVLANWRDLAGGDDVDPAGRDHHRVARGSICTARAETVLVAARAVGAVGRAACKRGGVVDGIVSV